MAVAVVQADTNQSPLPPFETPCMRQIELAYLNEGRAAGAPPPFFITCYQLATTSSFR
jgi:hypothetical protein